VPRAGRERVRGTNCTRPRTLSTRVGRAHGGRVSALRSERSPEAAYPARHAGSGVPMPYVPPPDPNEPREPEGFVLSAPAAIFLNGTPSPEADRVAAAVLDWRPGALIVATP
jgi:hypothetical protein